MGLEQIWGNEWLNGNEQRAYPLSEAAARIDTSGAFQIPDSFLVGLYLPVHAGLNVESSKFYLKRIAAFPTGFAIVVGYDDGTSDPPVAASTVIARAAHVEGTTYALPGVGDFADSVGRVVLGRLEEIDMQPAGTFNFTPAAGRLDTDCIRPMTTGVSSISVISGGDTSARFTGEVELVAGANIAIAVTTVGSSQQIRIDAIEGAGLTASCDCDEDTQLPEPIRTINGIPPKPGGDFDLVGNRCIDIAPIAHGLTLTDTCSQPCCGCPELEALTRELEHFGDEATSLRNYASQLGGVVDQFNAVVLGSRLGDFSCLECGSEG